MIIEEQYSGRFLCVVKREDCWAKSSCLTVCRALVNAGHDAEHIHVLYSLLCHYLTFSRMWGWWAGGRGFNGPLTCDRDGVTCLVWAACTDSPCSLTDMWKIPSVNLSSLPMPVVETLCLFVV